MCSDVLIYIGGPDLPQATSGYIKRTYTGFKQHDIIYFRFVAMFNGDWQPNDSFSVYFDDRLLKTQRPSSTLAPLLSSALYTCGSSNIATIQSNVVGRVFHTGDQATFKLSWNFPPPSLYSQGIAIKDLRMTFANRTSSDYEELLLMLQPGSVDNTACNPTYYQDSNGNCVSCNSLCPFCFGPAATDCYSIDNVGTLSNGDMFFACNAPGSYCKICQDNKCAMCEQSILGIDYLCSSSCTTPYVTFGNYSAKICVLPCSVSQFMYWNMTCQDTCNPPLVSWMGRQGKMCSYPCQLADDSFLYWNGSCLPTCPYFTRQVDNRRFCDACVPGFYLYDNGNCVASCLNPLNKTVVGGSQFCSTPCQSGYYLYNNGMCLPRCLDSLSTISVFGYNLCLNPCHSDEFVYDDGSCSPTCPAPYVQSTEQNISFCKLCSYPYQPTGHGTCELILSPSQAQQAKVIASILNGADVGLSLTSIILTALSSSNPTMVCFVTFTRVLFSIKYINVTYPPMLQRIFDEQVINKSLLGFVMTSQKKIEQSVFRYPLPRNFERYYLPSSFLVNFWPRLIFLSALIGGLVLVRVLAWVTKECHTVNAIFQRVLDTLRWNFIMTFLLSIYDEIIIFSSLEFYNLNIDHLLSIVSFLLALISISVIAFIFAAMLYVVIKVTRNENVSVAAMDQRAQILKRYKTCKVYIEPYKNLSLDKQAYLVIYSAKLCLIYLIISYLFLHPLTQLILILLLNTATLLYLVVRRPFRGTYNLIFTIIQEALLMLVNTCVLTLAVYDQLRREKYDKRDSLGDVIICCNIAFRVLGPVLIVVQVVFMAKGLYETHQKKKKKSRSIIIIQQSRQSAPPINVDSSQQDQLVMRRSSMIDQSYNDRTNVQLIDIFNEPDDNIQQHHSPPQKARRRKPRHNININSNTRFQQNEESSAELRPQNTTFGSSQLVRNRSKSEISNQNKRRNIRKNESNNIGN